MCKPFDLTTGSTGQAVGAAVGVRVACVGAGASEAVEVVANTSTSVKVRTPLFAALTTFEDMVVNLLVATVDVASDTSTNNHMISVKDIRGWSRAMFMKAGRPLCWRNFRCKKSPAKLKERKILVNLFESPIFLLFFFCVCGAGKFMQCLSVHTC